MTTPTTVTHETANAATANLYSLLIIDDETDILKALRRQFRHQYNIHIANSANEGYEIMTQTPIHVIISDQRMPGMSGVEFFDRTKNEFPDAIRLLLTGYADIQSVIAAINEGNVFRYITKPWDPAELDTIVREAFTKYTMIVENRRLVIQLQEANQFLEKRVQERTAEINTANAALLRLDAQKDAFMGMVAHDLRGPIGSIQMSAEFLRDLPPDQPEHAEFIGLIEETARNAIYLINDLLDIAAIEAGHLVIERQTVDIQALVARASHLNGFVAARKAIRLLTDVEAQLPKALVDPRRIEQVLNNLLSNAFKYSHANTTVRLRVWRHEHDLLLAVADDGQGIAPEEIDKLFKSFHRTSTRPTAAEHSTGLGLAICKRIVELHGGEISVHSRLGHGSTFTVRLPDSMVMPDASVA